MSYSLIALGLQRCSKIVLKDFPGIPPEQIYSMISLLAFSTSISLKNYFFRAHTNFEVEKNVKLQLQSAGTTSVTDNFSFISVKVIAHSIFTDSQKRRGNRND